jgi:NAD(P)-dependent dehydrogenase (short-subunit alcohol dehydrogenase family)
MNSAGELAGKVAVITGGSGGIGQAVVARLTGADAQVVVADLSASPDPLPAKVEFIQTDVSDSRSVSDLMASVDAHHGRLDILVNAAGIEIEKTIEETSDADWDRLMGVNLKGTFLVCREAIALLRKSGGGSIVNFGSYDGFIADPKLAAYCASKGGVHALTRAIAVDYGRENIRCNAVCPGYVDTPMLRSFFGGTDTVETLREEIAAIHPLGRPAKPDDIAGLVFWLAGKDAAYATGQFFVMDGGLTAQAAGTNRTAAILCRRTGAHAPGVGTRQGQPVTEEQTCGLAPPSNRAICCSVCTLVGMRWNLTQPIVLVHSGSDRFKN